MHPVFIQIGTFTIQWYGVMIATAFLAGLWVAKKQGAENQINEETIDRFALVALISAVTGARLYYIAFTDPAIFWTRPGSVLAVWEGGLAIHGAIIGGILAGIIFTRHHRISFWKFADTLAPSLILGQAIGRIGCFLNGDAHGYPTTLPWGLVYDASSPAGLQFPEQAIHPTQLYEMVLNLLIFLLLWKVRHKTSIQGSLFLLYMILYSAGRIVVEYFRADQLTYLGNISAAQSIGVAGIIIGSGFMIILSKKR